MKLDTMSIAHRIARSLRWGHYETPYKEHLRLGWKIAHMHNRILTVKDINDLKNNPTLKAHYFANVDLSLVRSMRKSDKFTITREKEITIKFQHYVRPLTDKENTELIGAMIESDRKAGIRRHLN